MVIILKCSPKFYLSRT